MQCNDDIKLLLFTPLQMSQLSKRLTQHNQDFCCVKGDLQGKDSFLPFSGLLLQADGIVMSIS